MTIAPTTNQIYAAFMHEIKSRLDDMQARLQFIHANRSNRSITFDAELTYLHVRFICELTALASLAAHHSYGLGKDLLKAWHAADIFDELMELNKHSFPMPITGTKGPDGITHFEENEQVAMSREELKQMYGQCGDALHRGHLKHALSGKRRVYDLDIVNGWRIKLLNFLSEHAVLLPQEQKVLLVNLNGDDGRVRVIEGQAPGPFLVSQNP